jgi:hypothetical protein
MLLFRTGGAARAVLWSSLGGLLLLVASFGPATTAHATVASWSSLGTVSPPFTQAFAPQVAETSGGDGVLVWARGTSQCSSPPCSQIEARLRYTPTGRIKGPGTHLTDPLSDPSQDALSPQVAMASNGDAVFVWERLDGTIQCGGSSCSRIETRFHSATTDTYSAVQTLSAAGENAHAPQVAIAPNGDSVFVWKRLDGTTQCGGSGCSRIQARTRSAPDALSAVKTLSLPGQNAFSPALSVDPDGGLDPNRPDALALWSRYDGTRCPAHRR